MITMKLGNMFKALLKSGLLVLWVWFCLKSVELVYQYKDGFSPFQVDPWIISSAPVLMIWFGILVFFVFKIIKIEI